MKFAHFADTHLGYARSDALQKIERDIFAGAIDVCISEKVDFVLMCGDIFHNNIPAMGVQKMAMEQFRRLYDNGISVYAVYGSHDFSPVNSSVIDLFVAAGYMIKPAGISDESGNISLDFITDKRTNVKIAGLSGLKMSRDKDYYENLDLASLESETGFKIFLFHGAISEMTSDNIGDTHMPLSLLPKGFEYYAGGHLHTFHKESFPDYDHVVYPGTLFAGHSGDMEDSANGKRRGFVIAEFDDNKIQSVNLHIMPSCEYHLIIIDADVRSSVTVSDEVITKTTDASVNDKVVIMKISGELSSGRTTDIDLGAARQRLLRDGAIDVIIYRKNLTSKEYDIRGESGGTMEEIETKTFQENIKQLRFKRDNLIGERGVSLAHSVLSLTRTKQPENESKSDYLSRINSDVKSQMELDI